jgi:hypothetical protein
MTKPAHITAEQRRELIIAAALSYMEHQDWYSAEDDDDPEVIAALERLYVAELKPRRVAVICCSTPASPSPSCGRPSGARSTSARFRCGRATAAPPTSGSAGPLNTR